MNGLLKLPFYAKFTILLVGVYVLISMLSIVQSVLLPLIYSAIIAILLSPVVNYLESKNFNRVMAVGLVLFFTMILIVVLVIFFVAQLNILIDAWPLLTAKFEASIDQFVAWASDNFNTRPKKINAMLLDAKKDFFEASNFGVGTTLATIGKILATFVLTPVYIVMFLYYQPHLVRFVHKLFGGENDGEISQILSQIKIIIKNYLVGLSIEIVIVAFMNSVGLIILGIPYAILLGSLGALLNLIPYVGGLIAVIVFMIVAMITKAPIYIFYVFIVYLFIQFIDNNLLVPRIVGSKVKLNAFVSILAVISGAALWGIPGMFLSIPLVAVGKLIAEHVKGLKPWAYLLGDSMPALFDLKKRVK